MKKIVCLCAMSIVILLSGCVSVHKAMTKVDRICMKPSRAEFLGDSEWVVIGNLFGGFGSFESEDIEKAFSTYEECSPGPNSLETVKKFTDAMAGWTSIEVNKFDVPLFFSVHSSVAVLIPQNTLDIKDFDIGIPGVWMGNGNLVAALWTPDHVFVISRTLCKREKGYRDCASEYERGLFDLEAGVEHTLDGKSNRNPVQIDTTTYKIAD